MTRKKTRLPTVIVLGGIELRRQRNTYYNTWEDVWACAEKRNTLERHKKRWRFHGGISRAVGTWSDTPEEAYASYLELALEQLRQKYEEERSVLMALAAIPTRGIE